MAEDDNLHDEKVLSHANARRFSDNEAAFVDRRRTWVAMTPQDSDERNE